MRASACSLLLTAVTACGSSASPNTPVEAAARPKEDPCIAIAATADQTKTGRAYWDATLCYERSGRLVEAFRYASLANFVALEAKDDAFVKEITPGMGDIMKRLPLIKLVSNGTPDTVQFDRRLVRPDAQFYADPGEHSVVATGKTSDGRPGRFESIIRAEEGKTTTVVIELR